METLAPGFRFCPTDEELLIWYLKPKALGKPFPKGTIADVDIYNYEPWELPDKSALSTRDPEWYFFSTQGQKYSHLARINRTTSRGYWKATGKDRKIYSHGHIVGLKKTLIFYKGRAPNGCRTNWIMHEYRLDQESEKEKGISVSVLCRIRRKGGIGPRNGEQYGAPVCNETDEVEDDNDKYELRSEIVNTVNDPGSLDEDHGKEGANAFDLQNQVKHLIPQVKYRSQAEPFIADTNESNARTTNGASDWQKNTHGMDIVAASSNIVKGKMDLGDVQYNYDTSFTDFVSDEREEDPASWYRSPGLGDYSALVNDGQYSFGSKEVASGRGATQFASSAFFGIIDYGDHSELDDRKVSLGAYASQSPVPVDLFFENGPLGDAFEDSWALQGSSTQSIEMLAPALIWSDGKVKNESVAAEQYMGMGELQKPVVEVHSHGVSEYINIPDTRNYDSEATGSLYGSNFRSCAIPHTVESSTQSYLSKKMPTCAVSKFEVAPPDMACASMRYNYSSNMHLNKKMVSAVFPSEDDQLIDLIKIKKSHAKLRCASATDSQYASDKLCKKIETPKSCSIGNEELREDKKGVNSVGASAPACHLTECVIAKESELEGVAVLASFQSQICVEGGSPRKKNVSIHGELDADPAIINSSRRRRVRVWLKNKLKQSAAGVRFTRLEEVMRAKINDRYTKPAVDLHQNKDDTEAFYRLKCGIVLILYHLGLVGLILSCIVWGYHVAMLCAASYVSVQ